MHHRRVSNADVARSRYLHQGLQLLPSGKALRKSLSQPRSEALAPSRFHYGNTVVLRNPQSLWRTLSCLLPGLNFIPNNFFNRQGVAKQRPLLIPIIARRAALRIQPDRLQRETAFGRSFCFSQFGRRTMRWGLVAAEPPLIRPPSRAWMLAGLGGPAICMTTTTGKLRKRP
jgi:hypothetical protein